MNLLKRLFATIVLLVVVTSSVSLAQEKVSFFEPGPRPDSLQPISEWENGSDVVQKIDLPNVGDAAEMTNNASSCGVVSPPIDSVPNKLFRIKFKASFLNEGEGGSYAPCGTPFADCDFDCFPKGGIPKKNFSLVYFSPEERNNTKAKLSRWNTTRGFRFADPKFIAVQPVFNLVPCQDAKVSAVLPLGSGESLDEKGEYKFELFKSLEITDYDRPLWREKANFKSNRWALGHNAYVVYRFALEPVALKIADNKSFNDPSITEGQTESCPRIPFTSGQMVVDLRYCDGGKFFVEGSLDGENWIELKIVTSASTPIVKLDSLFEGKERDVFYIRFRSILGTSQIQNVEVTLQTKQEPSQRYIGVGKTFFADLDADVPVDANAPNCIPWGLDEYEQILAVDSDGRFIKIKQDSELCVVEKTTLDNSHLNGNKITLKFLRPAVITLPEYPFFCQDYTNQILGAVHNSSDVSVSWTLADYRIPREPRQREIKGPKRIYLKSARNDYESFQIVVNPQERSLRNFTVETIGDLTSEAGNKISCDNIELFYEYYHRVTTPTDASSDIGWYPDALVPISLGANGKGEELVAEKGRNFVVYTTVYTPKDALPGVYHGKLLLKANDGRWKTETPFDVEVWDIELPEKNTILTGYGFGDGIPWEYHNCKTDDDKRAVFEKYLQLADKYRVSPFEICSVDLFDVQWFPEADPPKCEIDFSRFDQQVKRILAQYRFNCFRVELIGDSIEGYAFESSEYQSMGADFISKLYTHLKENNWLDVAYGCCFDEPTVEAYPNVAKTFGFIKKNAPDLKLLLTEEPSEYFCQMLEEQGAKIDYWCPLASNYSETMHKQRQKRGEESWIYICTGPKTPYCTEFIDHPGLEERIRFWQMYERGIIGDLMWAMTFWHSPAAYPNEYQNPYLDPMAYIPAESTETSVKMYWGNGDGRFMYPPLSAPVPGQNDGKLVLDSPNPCLRLDSVRSGIQDYELLKILEGLINDRKLSAEQQKRVEAIMDFTPVTVDMTNYTNDPMAVRDKREEIASLILELSGSRKSKE